jgi:hypothetical protein
MQTDQNEWVDVNEQAKLPILRDVVSGKYVYNILMSQSEHYNIIFDQVIQAHVVYDKRKFHSFLGPDGYIGYGFKDVISAKNFCDKLLSDPSYYSRIEDKLCETIEEYKRRKEKGDSK